MRVMHWGKGTVSCGLCGAKGHNIRTCPHYKDVLREAQLIVDHETKGTPIVGRYRWFTWQHAMALFEKKKRDNKKPRPKPTKKRKCSFCKETDHTKRNCSVKVEAKKVLYEANVIWRSTFLTKAKEVGIAPGALIKLKRFQSYSGGVMGWRVYKDTMSLVIGADWDELTFMNSYGLHWQYQALWYISHHLALDDDSVSVKIGQPELRQLFGNLFFSEPAKSLSVKNIEVITKAEVPLDEAWANNQQVKELDWLIAQHSLNQLEGELSILPWARNIIRNGIRP